MTSATRRSVDAVVIGGGPGGLSAALFLARRGARVALVERDVDPPNGSPDDDFDSWRRRGVPQARQSHTFLGLGCRVLAEEAPDVVDALRARGVLEVPASFQGHGAVEGSSNLLSRRLVFEAVLRRAVQCEPGVEVVTDAVRGLTATLARPRVVTGVTTKSEHTIRAPVVVDATGRRSPIADWAAALETVELPNALHRIGLQYYTRFYRLRDGAEYPSTNVPLGARLSYVSALAFPADNRTFSLSIACFVDDPYRRALAEPATFERVLSAVPLTRPWIEAGVAISPVHAMARIENRWRRLVDKAGEPLLGGIVLVGDSAMHTNPTFGRGISLAFDQARHLADTVGALDDPVAFTANFERWIEQHHGEWFPLQVAADQAMVATFQGTLRGEPRRPPPTRSGQLMLAMAAAASTDDVIARAMTCLTHLLLTPSEIFADADLLERLGAYIATHELTTPGAEGPTRAEFEAIVAAA